MSDLIKLGKYEIIKELGRGGFGIVYQARDSVLERIVALKILHTNLANDITYVKRFQQEAKLAAKLEHPNITPVYDFDQLDGRYFIAMAYMAKGSLKSNMSQFGINNPNHAKKVIIDISKGLYHAHRQGVIHRDLKPNNILLDEYGVARISDFGFAKALDNKNSLSLSITGNMLGTPSYIAPELWEGNPASISSDIYSLGCLAYEILVGKLLFDGESAAQIMTLHLIKGPTFSRGLEDSWKRILLCCLARSPKDRYKSLSEFLVDVFRITNAPSIPRVNVSNSKPVDKAGAPFQSIHQVPSKSADVKPQVQNRSTYPSPISSTLPNVGQQKPVQSSSYHKYLHPFPKNHLSQQVASQTTTRLNEQVYRSAFIENHQMNENNKERKQKVWIAVLLVISFLFSLGCCLLYIFRTLNNLVQ